MMQSPKYSPHIHFGSAFQNHLIRIWNLRISYPNDILWLWDDDVSGAFRHAKYHPDIAGAFAFTILSYFFLPIGITFGSTTSPAEYEPLAQARRWMATFLSNSQDGPTLAKKHHTYLNKVTWQHANLPTSHVKAVKDTFNVGIFDKNGNPHNTAHYPFVDDTLIVDVHNRLIWAMAASIEALFIVFGPEHESRKSPLSIDKFLEATCSWRKLQLGLIIDTSLMRVELPDEKRQKLLVCINSTWHDNHKSFTLLEGLILAGNLEHAALVCPWLRYCFVSLRHLINKLLQRARFATLQSSFYSQWMKLIRDSATATEKDLKEKFAAKKIAEHMYHSKKKMFITIELRHEISFLKKLLSENKHSQIWSPIAHLIPRVPTYTSAGDASLRAGGGFSIDLNFWWFFEWPPEIQNLTLDKFQIKQQNDHGDLISINLLEFVAFIINYIAANIRLSQLRKEDTQNKLEQYPVILNKCDNVSALKWILKAATASAAGRSLSRLTCSVMRTSPLGLNGEHLAGELNVIADGISRLVTDANSSPNFSLLMQEFPVLQNCYRFIPSAELVFYLTQSLLGELELDPPALKQMGHFMPDKGFT